MIEFVRNVAGIALEAAPWLLLGLVMAGAIRAWLPTRAIAARLGGSGLAPVATAALIGAPLPLCSCGVLPAAFGLRRAGASRAATASFLVSTPETGVDSIALSWALLGPFFAIVRPLAALASAIATGLAVGRFAPDRGGAVQVRAAALFDAEHAHGDGGRPHEHGHGHGHEHEHGHGHGHAASRTTLRAGLRYAFTDLLDDLAPWLGVGLLAAGAIVTLVPPAALAAWGGGVFAMLLMLAVAVPMYVCATASTPIAHAMLHAGVSPGTTLVFLLAGPATNIASLALLRRELGGRATAVYVAGVSFSALALGLLLDAVWASLGVALLSAGHAHDDSHVHALPLWLSAPALALLLGLALRRVVRPRSARRSHPAH